MSGAYYDENGVYHQGMLMPDGTRLNRGKVLIIRIFSWVFIWMPMF